jgi:glycosyltransferase involved in cell wall biosynthesis
MKDLRVLIIAEHASARFGGEAILPLHYFQLLRHRGVEAWMVVHARTRDELSALLPGEAGRIHYVPDTLLHQMLFAMHRIMPARVHYFTFGLLMRLLSQRKARVIARYLVRKHRICVVHQPIPVSPKEISILYDMGAPVVIGPMNGGMTYPPGFRRSEGFLTRAFTFLGRPAAHLIHRLLPGKLRAQTLLVANERTRRALPQGVRGRVIDLVENGVDLSLWRPAEGKREENEPVRFLFVGRLVDWKAVNLLLEAFARAVPATMARLDILGSGPLQGPLEAQAEALGLTGLVRFHGWVPQAEMPTHMRAAGVLVLPSLYECGGAVVLEAMASGLPVIATKWGGPSDYLDSTCGILVEPSSPQEFVAGLAQAMRELAASPARRRRLGQAGRERAAREFDWERKIDRILQIYAETVARARK